MRIRQAISTDSLLLSSLCVDVQSLHAKHHPDLFKMPKSNDFAVSFFDEILADPETSIFIAEENGHALGYVLCKLIERPENLFKFTMHYLDVEQISVRPMAQGQGIGAALIKQAELLARDANAQRIHLDSWGFNIEAHAFLRKWGSKNSTNAIGKTCKRKKSR